MTGAATVAPAKPKISAAAAQRTKAPRATHRNVTELTSPPTRERTCESNRSTHRPYGRSSHLEIGTSRFAQQQQRSTEPANSCGRSAASSQVDSEGSIPFTRCTTAAQVTDVSRPGIRHLGHSGSPTCQCAAAPGHQLPMLRVVIAALDHDGYGAGAPGQNIGSTADTLYIPNQNSAATYSVAEVRRVGRGTALDHKRVYLIRTKVTWPSNDL